MNRAAIIITNAKVIEIPRAGEPARQVDTSEQLLADLKAAIYALELWLTEPNPPYGISRDDLGASARLRAWIGEES